MAIGNVTNVIPASELPVMAEAEFLANVTVITVDGTGKMKQLARPALFNTISTVVQKGDKGDTGATGLTGAKGDKGDKGEKGDKGDTGLTGATGATGLQGVQGFSGWTPVLSIMARGTDEVLQVVNWTNPNPLATNKPSFPVYVSATGFTTNLSEAVNIKGAQGLQGLQGIQGSNGTNGTNGVNGWSPLITLREDTATNLVYFYLDSWIGGTGASPTTLGYISSSGVTSAPVAGSDIGSLPLTVAFSAITGKPTTLAGYGISDAYNESGQVKVNYTGLTLNNFTANTYKTFNIISATTSLSGSPTTTYPHSTPNSYAGVFDGARGNTPNGRLIENPIGGQVHAWRIQGSYSGKSTGGSGVELLYLRIRNPVSGFQITKAIVMPNGLAATAVYEEIITIADTASIPSPNGYVLEVASSVTDTGLTVKLDNITRISYAVEINR